MSLRTLASRALGCALLVMPAMAAHAQVTVSAVNATLRLVPPGITVAGAIQARVKNNSDGSPAVGVTVSFTAPASAPTLQFVPSNATSASAVTNSAGVATVNATAGFQPGLVQVQASAGTSSATVAALVIPGTLQIIGNLNDLFAFGAVTAKRYVVQAPWFPCAYASSGPAIFAGAATTLTANGFVLPTTSTLPTTCTNGIYQIPVAADVSALLPGTYAFNTIYGAPGGMGTLQSSGTVKVEPDFALPASGDGGPYQISLGWTVTPRAAGRCGSFTAATGLAGDAGFPATNPPGVNVPAGLLRVDATSCNWQPTLPHAGIGTLVQQALLSTGAALAPGTTAWAWGPTADNLQPHWYELSTSLSGTFAQFELVDGGAGDDSIGEDHELHAMLALGEPQAGDLSRGVQDLWWAGAQENGWGMSLTQHDDRLFAGLYIYDATGAPTWLVMSNGTWDATRTRYTGNLYRPHGTDFSAYDATQFRVGAAVGTLELTFTSSATLTLDYTIDGVSGSKSMQRQLFGPLDPFYAPAISDLWWGGVTQNGWGLAIAQQNSTAFGVIFTYDANGNPTWFVLPALRASGGTFSSTLYRTQGSPWVGAAYDASRLSVSNGGDATFAFDGISASLSYTVGGLAVSVPVVRQPF